MRRLFDPLTSLNFIIQVNPSLQCFFHENWCGTDVGIAMPVNGYMAMTILLQYINHFNKNIRKTVPNATKVLLLLDSHRSRMVFEWIQAGIKFNIVIVQSLANTSHFLQPAYQLISHMFKQFGQLVHDSLSYRAHPTTSMQFKLIRGVYGYNCTSKRNIIES